MLLTLIIVILAMACVVVLAKTIAMILPDSVRAIIGGLLLIGGVIYLFIQGWAWGVFAGIPWAIACILFISGSDID